MAACVNWPIVEDPIVKTGPVFVLELVVVAAGMENTGSERGLLAVEVL